jgi:hypothetical protein
MTRASRAIFVTCILALTTVASMAADTLEEAVAAYRKADYDRAADLSLDG